jgi:molybdopterin-guanine dinucleotide biosynthesis protein A
MPDQLQICILAGGGSRRMGRPKALIRLGRFSLLRHAFMAARTTGLPIRVLRHDAIPPCGPLSGVYTALAQSPWARAILFLSCDMPFVSPNLLQQLLQAFQARGTPVFASQQQRPGFPFILPANTLPLLHQQLQAGRLSLRQLAAALQAAQLELPPESRQLLNLNTPAELQEARQILHTGHLP